MIYLKCPDQQCLLCVSECLHYSIHVLDQLVTTNMSLMDFPGIRRYKVNLAGCKQQEQEQWEMWVLVSEYKYKSSPEKNF